MPEASERGHLKHAIGEHDPVLAATSSRQPLARLPFNGIALLIVLLLFSCLFVLINAAIIGMEGFDLGTLMLAGTASLFPALLYATLGVLLDVREREPFHVLALAFLWGAFVAMAGSYIINTGLYIVATVAFGSGVGELISIVIGAPLIEEAAKAAGLLVILWFFRREFNNVTDGIVYGSLIGIGFGMAENVLYLGGGYLQSGTEEFSNLFYLRVILGGFGHAGYTALTGAGFGYLRETDTGVARIAAPLVGLFAAILGHAAWNSVFALIIGLVLVPDDFFRYYVVVPLVVFLGMLPGYVAVLVLLIRSWRREAAVIMRYLETEVGAGLLSHNEYERLASARQRLSFELRALTGYGVGAWLSARRFHQRSTRLAFRKWQLSRGDRSAMGGSGLDVEFRDPIRKLRANLPPVFS
jgi:protease PrsW